jgi:hypothetical protein
MCTIRSLVSLPTTFTALERFLMWRFSSPGLSMRGSLETLDNAQFLVYTKTAVN